MALLEIKGFKKKFENLEVLKGIDFELEKGETLAIIGSSGSGKTTLLRCLNFLESPDEGKMYLKGELLFDSADRQRASEAAIRKKRLHFGLVFQNFNLFPQYNVFENLCLAPKLLAKERADFKANKKKIYEEIEENAGKLLRKVGLADREKSYPCQLSGGQQQRVAIARALAMSPNVLCFDNMTMIVVTHEMRFAAEVADRILFMHEGVVAFDGDSKTAFSADCPCERLRNFIGSIEK